MRNSKISVVGHGLWFKMVFAIIILLCYHFGSAQNKLVAEIPFVIHGAHVMIEASVNGSEPIKFVFDTGAQGASMDSALAKKIGLKADGQPVLAMGASGERIELERSTNNTLTIGGLKFENSTFSLKDMAGSRSIGRIHQGVLGYPQLSLYVVEFDYQNSVLRFYDQEEYSYSGQGVTMDIDVSMRIPQIDLEFETKDGAKERGRAFVDTGASSTISLNTPVVERNDMINKAGKTYKRLGLGLTGAFEVYTGRIKSASFGDFTFTDLPVTMSTSKTGLKASNRVLGVIGNNVMKRFKVTFDYAKGKMYLEPNQFYKEAFKVNCSGLSYHHKLTANKGLEIIAVIPDSPVAQIGLKPGDELMSVNGKSVDEYELNELAMLLETDGKKIKIAWLSNGELHTARVRLRALI